MTAVQELKSRWCVAGLLPFSTRSNWRAVRAQSSVCLGEDLEQCWCHLRLVSGPWTTSSHTSGVRVVSCHQGPGNINDTVSSIRTSSNFSNCGSHCGDVEIKILDEWPCSDWSSFPVFVPCGLGVLVRIGSPSSTTMSPTCDKVMVFPSKIKENSFPVFLFLAVCTYFSLTTFKIVSRIKM